MPAINVIKLRRGVASLWTSTNPVLAAGEPGFETDTKKLKFGDGTTAWNSLQYVSGGASVNVSDTAPTTNLVAGTIWWNSLEGRAYIYYDTTWVELSPAIPGPAGPTGVQTAATAPSNTSVIWNDTSSTGTQVMPANGTKGQVLTKLTDSSYDTTWTTPTGSGNAIINGAFDIWQRGTSLAFGSVMAYGPDRWVIVRAGWGSGATVSRQSSGLTGSRYCARVQRDSGNTSTGFYGITSSLETADSIKFAGQTVTLSFYARKGANYSESSSALLTRVISGTGVDQTWISGFTGQSVVIQTTVTLSSSWQRFTYTGVVPSDSSGIAVDFENYTPTGTAGAADYFEITGVQLETGNIATPFRRAGGTIQGELAACQRYYYRLNAAQYRHMGQGPVTSANACEIQIPLPVEFRVPPLSVESSGTYLFDGVATKFPSSITNGSGSTRVGVAIYNLTGGFVAPKQYIALSNSATDYLGFNAEL